MGPVRSVVADVQECQEVGWLICCFSGIIKRKAKKNKRKWNAWFYRQMRGLVGSMHVLQELNQVAVPHSRSISFLHVYGCV